jgi:hypothetical protein
VIDVGDRVIDNVPPFVKDIAIEMFDGRGASERTDGRRPVRTDRSAQHHTS